MIDQDSPFHPDNEAGYQVWRAQKLAAYPQQAEELIVQVEDPARLSDGEYQAIWRRVAKTGMAVYATNRGEVEDKSIPRDIAAQFGLTHLDANWLADEDGISSLTPQDEGGQKRGEFIPYTHHRIRWHTDGYYNPPARRICGMILHCVQSAEAGGENRLLDHEIAYILLRDQNPEFIRALSAPDVMTIPARMSDTGVARAAETGPVFSVLPDGGALHMRYTARTKSIEWKDTPQTRAAVAALEAILAGDSSYVFQGRLEPGMGLICNNVLHDRTGFNDSPEHKRIIYRGRYLDRITGS